MKIEILGDGCVRCRTLKKNVEQAVEALDLPAEVSAVMDPGRIAELGVRSLPQLVVDGKVVMSNTPGTVERIKEILSSSRSGS